MSTSSITNDHLPNNKLRGSFNLQDYQFLFEKIIADEASRTCFKKYLHAEQNEEPILFCTYRECAVQSLTFFQNSAHRRKVDEITLRIYGNCQ